MTKLAGHGYCALTSSASTKAVSRVLAGSRCGWGREGGGYCDEGRSGNTSDPVYVRVVLGLWTLQ